MASLEKIGGRTFSFGILPATEALSVQVSIARVIGEPLFKALTEADGGKDKARLLELGGAALGLMAARMDSADLLKTMQTTLTYVSVDGERVNIDKHFTGKPKELWQVFMKALQENFADFFDVLPSAFGPAGAASKSKQ